MGCRRWRGCGQRTRLDQNRRRPACQPRQWVSGSVRSLGPIAALDLFSEPVRAWFATSFPAPTAAQAQGWPAIAAGDHTLILAPTGSGKTLAAFLWGIDRLMTDAGARPGSGAPGCSTSRRCGRWPSTSRRTCGRRSPASRWRPSGSASPVHEPTVGMRTGDTPADERRRLVRHPPDMLITTPESLYLMLTSQARETLRDVEAVIIDEIHALAATKRGAHLALTLERLEAIVRPARRSASACRPRSARSTRSPASSAASTTTAGPRPVTIVDAGMRKALEVEVVVPVDDMGALGEVIEEPIERARPPAGPVRRSHLAGDAPAAARADPAAPLDARSSSTPAGWPSGWPPGSTSWPLEGETARGRGERHRRRRAGDELVKAHHGSLSRERRLQIEDELKSGRLQGLVATSIARARHRHGRGRPRRPGRVARRRSPRACSASAGPATRSASRAGASSSPSTAATWSRPRSSSQRMHDGPHRAHPLPAQPARRARPADRRHVRARRVDGRRAGRARAARRPTSPSCPTTCSHAVLDLLAGRYPSDEFAELRPRIVWDRVDGIVRGRAGAQRLAVTSGGTIPDRGLFGVFLPDGTRVGELDEEMVYESRPGETFLLGASTWRIEEITYERVDRHARRRASPGKMPFWHGDGPGRPLELGRAVGAFVRDDPRARADRRRRAPAATSTASTHAGRGQPRRTTSTSRPRPPARCPTTARSWSSASATRSATGGCASSSPFGAQVHAPWAMALQARLAERWGLDVELLWSDDGIVLRLPEAVDELPIDELLDRPRRDRRARRRPAARARRCSRRASASARPGRCCCPAAGPTSARRCGSSARRRPTCWRWRPSYPTFPILLETTRECLNDVFDLPALREVLADLRAREVRVVAGRHAAGVAVRAVAAVRLDRRLHVRGRRAAGRAPGRRAGARPRPAARPARRRGAARAARPRRAGRPRARAAAPGRRPPGPRRRRAARPAARARPADAEPSSTPRCRRRDADAVGRRSWCAERRAIEVADRRRGRARRGRGRRRGCATRSACALPHRACPAAFTEPVDAPARRPRRPLRPHPRPVPRPRRSPRRLGVARRPGAARARAARGRGPGRARRVPARRRRARVVRRRRAAPAAPPVAGRAAPRGRAGRRPRRSPGSCPRGRASGRPRRGLDGLVEVARHAAGRGDPGVGARGRRAAGPRGRATAPPTSTRCAPPARWCGSAPARSAPTDGRVRLVLPRPGRRCSCPPPTRRAARRPAARRAARAPRRSGARRSGPSSCGAAAGRAAATTTPTVLAALWDLVWAGLVTNDSLAPLRALRRRGGPRARRRGGRGRPAARPAGPARPARGRRAVVAGRAAARAARRRRPRPPTPAPCQLLERYGVLTREAALGEGVEGGFAGVYPVLKALEERGQVRRGYFVAGLGAAQFALPGAVDRLRGAATAEPATTSRRLVVLAATDPAQPYGARCRGPRPTGRPGPRRRRLRRAGRRRARRLPRAGRAQPRHVPGRRRAAPAGPTALVPAGRATAGYRSLEIPRSTANPARGVAAVADELRDAGFVDGYKGLVLHR